MSILRDNLEQLQHYFNQTMYKLENTLAQEKLKEFLQSEEMNGVNEFLPQELKIYIDDRERLKIEIQKAINGELDRFENIKICEETPQILQDVGLENLPILFTQKHLRDGLHEKSPTNVHYHGLKIEDYLNLEENLQNPAIIMDSFSDPDSIIVVTATIDSDKAPIIACIQNAGTGIYQCKNINANFLTSLYGKDFNFDKFLQANIENDKILYANKEKIQELEQCANIQSVGAFSSLEYDKIISQSKNIVNNKKLEELYARNDEIQKQNDELGKNEKILVFITDEFMPDYDVRDDIDDENESRVKFGKSEISFKF